MLTNNPDKVEGLIKKLNENIGKQILVILEVIKFQYDFQNLKYNQTDVIKLSKCFDNKDNITIIIHSNNNITVNDTNNTIYININPISLVAEFELPIIKLINRNLWVIFLKCYEIFFVEISIWMNNISNIIIQDNFICKQFFKRINHLIIMSKSKIVNGDM